MAPGKTTRKQVSDKFGEPSKEFSRGGRLSDGVSYRGEEAISGAKEAIFYFDKHAVLSRIDVFPSRSILREQVLKIFGKDFVERVTRTGHTVFEYKVGMVVFFEKNGIKVQSFMFTQPGASSEPGT